VARACSQFDTAQAAYDEGLQVLRQLAEQLGTPQALRDLSVSLSKVGDVARARSQFDAAQAAYDEGLQVSRQLAEQLGTPEALRDLSVSLNQVGDVAVARSQFDTAQAAYDGDAGAWGLSGLVGEPAPELTTEHVTLRWVPGGTFEMGSPPDEPGRDDDERQHTVTVDGLYVMKTEVTQGLWSRIMESNPSHFEACGSDCPVDSISWFEAVEFANRLSTREGLEPAYIVSGTNVTWDRAASGYRLLTEAEWEFAARGGEAYRYAGSDTATEVGWVEANAGGTPHRVCDKPVKGYGLCDMTGNVWEWVWDGYGDYSAEARHNPSGPESGDDRVIRGGSWYSPAADARVANRDGYAPDFRWYHLGLRLARPAP